MRQTVSPAVLTVTADDASRAYGQPDPAFTATITGFVNGETSGVISGAASLSTAATSASGVGSYTITAAQGSLAATNYTFAFQAGTLTVTAATLTVTVDDASRAYGQANPAFTATITGFVNGDTSGVVAGTAALSNAATAGSGVGSYTITAAHGSLSAANYTFAFQAGVLTVTPATLTVIANDASKAYGQVNPAFSATYSGFVNGDTFRSSAACRSALRQRRVRMSAPTASWRAVHTPVTTRSPTPTGSSRSIPPPWPSPPITWARPTARLCLL
jgi:hypothetical protein